MRNNENISIKILRNSRLNKLIKLNYLNAFLIKNDIFDLIMRKSKFQHKTVNFEKFQLSTLQRLQCLKKIYLFIKCI